MFIRTLAHVDAWQWTPDLIWFDNVRSFGSANYYVQKAFSNNKGTNVVPILRDNEVVEGKDSLYASSVIDKKTGELIIKLVNANTTARTVEISVKGASINSKTVSCQVMQSENIKDCNTIDTPAKISPKPVTIQAKGKKIMMTVEGNSFYLIKVKYKS